MLKKLIIVLSFSSFCVAAPAFAQKSKIIISGMSAGTSLRVVGMPPLKNCNKVSDGYVCPKKLNRDYGPVIVNSAGQAEFTGNTKGMGRICALLFEGSAIVKQSCVDLPEKAGQDPVLVNF